MAPLHGRSPARVGWMAMAVALHLIGWWLLGGAVRPRTDTTADAAAPALVWVSPAPHRDAARVRRNDDTPDRRLPDARRERPAVPARSVAPPDTVVGAALDTPPVTDFHGAPAAPPAAASAPPLNLSLPPRHARRPPNPSAAAALVDPASNTVRPTFAERFALALGTLECIHAERLPDGSIVREPGRLVALDPAIAAHGGRGERIQRCVKGPGH